VPSHRADTPTDASTALLSRATAHPPRQRRRDLRGPRDPFPVAAGAPVRPGVARSAGLSWLDDEPGRGRFDPADSPGLPVDGALALDPFALPAPRVQEQRPPQHHDDPVTFGLPVEQPARQSEALPTRRSLRVKAAQQPLPAAVPTVASPSPALSSPETSAETSPAASAAPRRARGERAQRAASEPASRRASALGLPQVGIAGALGIATIAVPLSGAFAVAPATRPTSNTVATAASAALQPLPPFPLVARAPLTALDDVRLLPDQTEGAQVPARLAAPRVVLSDRASRSDQRAVLPGCDGRVPDVADVANGQLPASMLCTLWDPRRQLRSDAAVALAKVNLSYRARFGHDMCFNDAYRSLAQQYRVKAERGGFAARPGTSEHGWGLAVDLCDGVENGSSSATYQWMRQNAAGYGWSNPTWALPGGAGPYEPWHWEYLPGEKNQSAGD
jgi:D-alanyl-D-alanine carboxypeptidase